MKLTPGSEAAVKAGCTCPVIDNHHGQGVMLKGEVAFWRHADCPLHGRFRPALSASTQPQEPV
jgi:hypothetical protein